MKKVAIVRQQGPSEWASCRAISGNLLNAYRLVISADSLAEYELAPAYDSYAAFETAERIRNFQPDVLVFLDHALHPSRLLHCLAEMGWSGPAPRLVFHLYGDFCLSIEPWIEMVPVLRSYDCHFVCASERHLALVGSLLSTTPAGLHWVPFPVDPSQFGYTSGMRTEARSERAVAEGTFVFLYSGRLSLQKNVLQLVGAFADFTRAWNAQAELWLCGSLDDIGLPYLGKIPPRGLMSFDLMDLMESRLGDDVRSRIRIIDNQEAKSLHRIYLAADAYVSLSTHNDEDYGMAPAEAAMCGLPLLLSDWGGFSSFESLLSSEAVTTIPVRMDKTRVLPEHVHVVKALARFSGADRGSGRRERISVSANEALSLSAVSKRLAEVLFNSEAARFSGFTPLGSRVAQAFRMSPSAPFGIGMEYSSLYREVYRSYV